jgi:hypothetical protein
MLRKTLREGQQCTVTINSADQRQCRSRCSAALPSLCIAVLQNVLQSRLPTVAAGYCTAPGSCAVHGHVCRQSCALEQLSQSKRRSYCCISSQDTCKSCRCQPVHHIKCCQHPNTTQLTGTDVMNTAMVTPKHIIRCRAAWSQLAVQCRQPNVTRVRPSTALNTHGTSKACW